MKEPGNMDWFWGVVCFGCLFDLVAGHMFFFSPTGKVLLFLDVKVYFWPDFFVWQKWFSRKDLLHLTKTRWRTLRRNWNLKNMSRLLFKPSENLVGKNNKHVNKHNYPPLALSLRWTPAPSQVKDQVQMLLVQDLLDTLSKSMDILPYRREPGNWVQRRVGTKITTTPSCLLFPHVVVYIYIHILFDFSFGKSMKFPMFKRKYTSSNGRFFIVKSVFGGVIGTSNFKTLLFFTPKKFVGEDCQFWGDHSSNSFWNHQLVVVSFSNPRWVTFDSHVI